MTEQTVKYSMEVVLERPYHDAVQKVTEALTEEGFGVITEIDVKATIKEKLGLGFRRYVILGACNPQLAHRALNKDLEIGLLLPCNVVVYEIGENRSTVLLADPVAMLQLAHNPDLESIAAEARARFQRVAEKLVK